MLTCKDMKNSLCWLENKWIWFISFSFLCCETLYEWAGSIWFRYQDPKGSKTFSGSCCPQSLIRNTSNRSSTKKGEMCVNWPWKISQSDHIYIDRECGFCQDFVHVDIVLALSIVLLFTIGRNSENHELQLSRIARELWNCLYLM